LFEFPHALAASKSKVKLKMTY